MSQLKGPTTEYTREEIQEESHEPRVISSFVDPSSGRTSFSAMLASLKNNAGAASGTQVSDKTKTETMESQQKLRGAAQPISADSESEIELVSALTGNASRKSSINNDEQDVHSSNSLYPSLSLADIPAEVLQEHILAEQIIEAKKEQNKEQSKRSNQCSESSNNTDEEVEDRVEFYKQQEEKYQLVKTTPKVNVKGADLVPNREWLALRNPTHRAKDFGKDVPKVLLNLRMVSPAIAWLGGTLLDYDNMNQVIYSAWSEGQKEHADLAKEMIEWELCMMNAYRRCIDALHPYEFDWSTNKVKAVSWIYRGSFRDIKFVVSMETVKSAIETWISINGTYPLFQLMPMIIMTYQSLGETAVHFKVWQYGAFQTPSIIPMMASLKRSSRSRFDALLYTSIGMIVYDDFIKMRDSGMYFEWTSKYNKRIVDTLLWNLDKPKQEQVKINLLQDQAFMVNEILDYVHLPSNEAMKKFDRSVTFSEIPKTAKTLKIKSVNLDVEKSVASCDCAAELQEMKARISALTKEVTTLKLSVTALQHDAQPKTKLHTVSGYNTQYDLGKLRQIVDESKSSESTVESVDTDVSEMNVRQAPIPRPRKSLIDATQHEAVQSIKYSESVKSVDKVLAKEEKVKPKHIVGEELVTEEKWIEAKKAENKARSKSKSTRSVSKSGATNNPFEDGVNEIKANFKGMWVEKLEYKKVKNIKTIYVERVRSKAASSVTLPAEMFEDSTLARKTLEKFMVKRFSDNKTYSVWSNKAGTVRIVLLADGQWFMADNKVIATPWGKVEAAKSQQVKIQISKEFNYDLLSEIGFEKVDTTKARESSIEVESVEKEIREAMLKKRIAELEKQVKEKENLTVEKEIELPKLDVKKVGALVSTVVEKEDDDEIETKNWISLIKEYCDMSGVPHTLNFVSQKRGEDHCPEYRCVLKWRDFNEAGGWCKTVKAAKQSAAQAVYMRLQHVSKKKSGKTIKLGEENKLADALGKRSDELRKESIVKTESGAVLTKETDSKLASLYAELKVFSGKRENGFIKDEVYERACTNIYAEIAVLNAKKSIEHIMENPHQMKSVISLGVFHGVDLDAIPTKEQIMIWLDGDKSITSRPLMVPVVYSYYLSIKEDNMKVEEMWNMLYSHMRFPIKS